MNFDILLLIVALVALYFVFKAKRYQKEHASANADAKARLDGIEQRLQQELADWGAGKEADLPMRQALKAGLAEAYEFGAELVGSQQNADNKALKALLGEFLEAEAQGAPDLRWRRYHTALHCAVLMGQQAAQPKMAEQIRFKVDKLREAMKADQ
ncbi:hypothetical protein [Ferrimonas marina]|uniref:Uncharacterized protein n=1 Tax=Ferrimonas marina TaxID=299255 RepID=A0A1M5XVK9_9GAMM|nr:hypothetical protein [Ferrimonas marina]SHI03574.1 hypothetical protein SAMN02745129_3718 [Ferrimonas marina]